MLGGTGNDDGIGGELTVLTDDDVARVIVTSDLGDRCSHVDRCTVRASEIRGCADERGHAVARCTEDGAGVATAAKHLSRTRHEASATTDEFVELRHAVHAEGIGVGCIDAADEWVDDALEYLIAAARTDRSAE